MNDIKAGWLHFWTVFTRSWGFVVGFLLASLLSEVIVTLLKHAALSLR